MSYVEQDTVDLETSATGDQHTRMVGLTIAQHPDVARVGEVSELFSERLGGRAELSRLEPLFGAAGRPLETPLVSRRAILIRTDEQGALLIENAADTRCQVNGQAAGSERFPAGELEQGIVIELGGSVSCLLHYLGGGERSVDDLGLLGESAAVRRLRTSVLQVADSRTPVLVRGESGSGKELVARAIHDNSPRAKRAFVAVNAAAIPQTMAAAALFGHSRGAFTGANVASPGYFGQADGGTLFLDEVGELGRDLQGLLLRAAREGEIQPVGDTRPKRVDVRLLTATDADLETQVEQGDFSMPLLRRLEAFTVRVPPLRQRRDDIARLFFHFLRHELEQVGESWKLKAPTASDKPWLPVKLMRRLLTYAWPGNVAELQTVARHIAITNRGVATFGWSTWLETRLAVDRNEDRGAMTQSSDSAPSAGTAVRSEALTIARPKTDARALTDVQIVEAMAASQFRVSRAAELLGVSRSWLHTRIEFCRELRQAKELTAAEITHAAQQCNNSLPQMVELLRVSEHGLKLRMSALDISLGPGPP